MIVISRNDVVADNLDSESLNFLMALGDEAIVEIAEGDESTTYRLGCSGTIANLDFFESGDRLISSYIEESGIPFKYIRKEGRRPGEFIYECIGPLDAQ